MTVFKTGDNVRTQIGQKVVICADDAPGESPPVGYVEHSDKSGVFSAMWGSDGKSSTSPLFDLVHVIKPTTWWVNEYTDGPGYPCSTLQKARNSQNSFDREDYLRTHCITLSEDTVYRGDDE